jgi:hypothetical protein
VSFLTAALIGVGLVALPWVSARLMAKERQRQVSLQTGFWFPTGVGLLAAAAMSFVAKRQGETGTWWGLVSFGVVAWLVAEYQRWHIRNRLEASQDPTVVEEWPRFAARWLYRIVMVITVLGWLLLGDWCCFQYVD